MGSRKTLNIILIVGLVIFIVSFAIGRPLWQAALFSVGFLLVATVVTTTGVLIPERLFVRRLPGRSPAGKPTKATDKAEFLKRVDVNLTEFSAQPGGYN